MSGMKFQGKLIGISPPIILKTQACYFYGFVREL